MTTKEKIQLYLLENRFPPDEYEAPFEVTQTGIAQGVGIQLSHFRQYIRPLLEKGVVAERSSRIRGGSRKRKVYSLEREGIFQATKLKEDLMKKKVRFFDLDGGIIEGAVLDVIRASGNISLVQLVNEMEQNEVIDPTRLRKRAREPEVRFVDFSRTSPKPERFVGRKVEIRRIINDIERGRIVVIQGIAGIGKTSLGSMVCSEVKKRASVFWYEFRAWQSLWALLSEVARFLGALGSRNLLKYLKSERRVDLRRIQNILKEDLGRHRTVLFFDDFQRASEEIVGFIAHLAGIVKHEKDVAMVVMTREFIPFYDKKEVEVNHVVNEIRLEGLDRMSSRELVGEAVEEFGMFEKVYEATQGHPLFLELIASIPVVGPELRLDYVDRFIEEEIYLDLNEKERRMMKIASVYENPVQISALLSEENLDIDTLVSLKKKTLVTTLADGKVQVHDTIRKSFRSMLTPQEKEYYHLSAAKNLLGESDPILQLEGVHHLLVTGDILWATDILMERGEEFIDRGYDEEVLSLLMEFDPNLIGPREKGAISEREGDVLRIRGHIESAIKKYDESKKRYAEAKVDDGEARVGWKMGACYSSIGKFDDGLKELTRALSILGEDKDSILGARILGSIGSIMARKGKYQKALEFLVRDFMIAWRERDRKELARVLNQLGYIFYQTGAHERALEFQKMSLKTKERIIEEWRKYSEL